MSETEKHEMAATEHVKENGASKKAAADKDVAVKAPRAAETVAERPIAANAIRPVAANAITVEPDDQATRDLLDRASRSGIMPENLVLEALAAQLTTATGIPMKASNMAERLMRAKAEGKITPEAMTGVMAAIFGSMDAEPAAHAAPVEPAAPSAAAAAAGPTRLFRGAVRAATPPSVPAAPAADPLKDYVAQCNRARRRPAGMKLPDEAHEMRLFLDLEYRGAERQGEDVLIPPESEITVLGRVPGDADFDLADLRRIQFHPFGLDRLLVAHVTVDSILIGAQGPATQYARADGSPSGTVGKTSVVAVRIRNLTRGVSAVALSIVVVPYASPDDAGE